MKRFEHEDDSRFVAQRDALVKEFRGWLVEQRGDREGEPAAAAETFINWQWNYTEGDLFGRHHPDKRAAKAARKAAMKHRSWMANRRS